MKLQDAVKEFGAKNIRIFIEQDVKVVEHLSMFKYIEKITKVLVEYYICEDFYKVKNDFKVELKPINKKFYRETFYISDFNSLMKEHDTYKMFCLSQVEDEVYYTEI